MAITSITKNNIGDAVLEQLKETIASGEWPPGTKIPSENELARTMGVSRVSIRGALQKLSSVGLLDIRQGEGTYVCELDGSHYMNSIIPIVMLDKHNAASVWEFRYIIECESAALAANRATSQEIEDLWRNYYALVGQDRFSEQSSILDVEFHVGVAKATHNPLIIRVMDILQDVLLEAVKDIAKVMKKNSAIRDHKRILEAIQARKPEQAKKEMEKHLQDLKPMIGDQP